MKLVLLVLLFRSGSAKSWRGVFDKGVIKTGDEKEELNSSEGKDQRRLAQFDYASNPPGFYLDDDFGPNWCFGSPNTQWLIDCDAGTYSTDGSISTGSSAVCASNGYCTSCGCDSCEAGKYSDAAATECTECPQGKYASSSGSSSCTDCPDGYYTSSTGSTSCTAAEAGYYATNSFSDDDGEGVTSGASYEVACPSGYYSTGTASSCDQCDAGAYTNTSSAATSCSTCPAGYYSLAGSTSCSACPRGTYGIGGSTSSACDGSCDPGRYGDETALVTSECSGACLSGYYGGYGETTQYCTAECTAGYRCATGTGYDQDYGIDERTPCGDGYSYPASVYCPTGTGKNPTAVSSGYYSTPTTVNETLRYGQTQCTAGYYCQNGEESCCPAGYYGEDDGETDSFCTDECPSGYICEECCSSPEQCTDSVDADLVDPAAYFCPAGSSSYKKAPEGYFTTPYAGSKYTRTGYQSCQDDDYCEGDGSFVDLVEFSTCPASVTLPEASGDYYDFGSKVVAYSARSENDEIITYAALVRGDSTTDFTDTAVRYFTFDDGDCSDSADFYGDDSSVDVDCDVTYTADADAINVDSTYGDTCLYGYGCLYAAGDDAITYEAALIDSWLADSFTTSNAKYGGTGATLAFWMRPDGWSSDDNDGIVGIARITFSVSGTFYHAVLYMYDTTLYLDMGTAAAWTGTDDDDVVYTMCYIEEPDDVDDNDWSHFALTLSTSRVAVVLDGETIASSYDIQDYFSDLASVDRLNVTEIALSPNVPDVDDSTSDNTVWYGAGGAKYFDDVFVFAAELYDSEIAIVATEDAVLDALEDDCSYNKTIGVNATSGALYAQQNIDYSKCEIMYATVRAKLPSDSSSSSSGDSITFCSAPYASEIFTVTLSGAAGDDCTGDYWADDGGYLTVTCGNHFYNTTNLACGEYTWKCVSEDYAVIEYELEAGTAFDMYTANSDGSGDSVTIASCDTATSDACDDYTSLYHTFSRNWDTRSGAFLFNVTDDSVNHSKSCTMESDASDYISLFGSSIVYDNSEVTITVVQRQTDIERNMALWLRVQSWPDEDVSMSKELNGYMCVVWTDATEYIASLKLKYYAGDAWASLLAETDDTFTYRPDFWYTVKFTADGSTLLCQIWEGDEASGDAYVTLSATDDNFQTGMVAVHTYRDDSGPHYWNSINVNGTELADDDEYPTPAPSTAYTPAPTYFKTDYDIYYPTAYAYCTVLVEVEDTNDAPECFPSNITFHIDEYSDLYDLVGESLDNYCSDDDDLMQSITFSINETCGDGDLYNFGIESCGGQLYVLNDELDASADQTEFIICVLVCDDGGLCTTMYVTVVVDDVNDSPVIHEDCPVVVYLAENSVKGTETDQSTLNATDPDEGDTLTWSLYTDPWSGILAIDATTGIMYANSSDPTTDLDYESQITYAGFVMAVTDSGGLSATCEVTLKLLDENDDPSFDSSTTTFYLAEDADPGDDIGDASATDEDGDTLSYSLDFAFASDDTGSYAWLFDVDSSGELYVSSTAGSGRVSNAIDYEDHTGRYFTVGVKASDGNGGTALGNFTVSITDANDAPVANTSIFYVEENIDYSPYFVGNVTVYDQDVEQGTQSLSYYITKDDDDTSGAFDFKSDSVPTVVGNFALDYESQSTFELTYKVTDDGVPSESDTASIIVYVVDVNESPSLDEYDTELAIYENSGAGASVLIADGSSYETFYLADYASDPDDSDSTYGTLTYSISDDADGAFAIDESSGLVYATESFDYESGDDSYTITLVVTDGGGLSASLDYTVTILDVNEKPTAINTVVWLPTGTDTGTTLGTLKSSDPEDNTLSYNLTISDEFSGVSVGGILLESIVNFTTYTSGATSVYLQTDVETIFDDDDDNQENGFNFTYEFSAYETSTSNRYYSSNKATLTIAMVYESYNDAPSFDNDGDTFYMDENSDAGTVIGTLEASDDNDDQTLTYEIVSTAPSAAADYMSLDSSTGELTVTTSSYFDYEAFTDGQITINAQVTDSYKYPASAEGTFTIQLVDVAEAPVLATISSNNFYVSEDATEGTIIGDNITATDDDADDSYALTYTLSSDGDDDDGVVGSVFELVQFNDASSGNTAARLVVAADSVLDYETKSSYTLTITVSDTSGLTDSADFTVTVKNVNEAPEFEASSYEFSVAEDVASTTTVGTVAADDEDGNVLKYAIIDTDDDDDFPFSITSLGGSIYVSSGASLDYETTSVYTFTVLAYESSTTEGYNDTAFVTVYVTDVNDITVSSILGSVNSDSTLGTLGGEVVTITGTNFGPLDNSDVDVEVTVRYYDIDAGVTFFARNCSISVPNTEIQCLSDEGVGTDHTWNITLTGTDTDTYEELWTYTAEAGVTTSYTSPTISALESMVDSDGASITDLPTAGGAYVTFNGTGFPPYCTLYCSSGEQPCGGDCLSEDASCGYAPYEGSEVDGSIEYACSYGLKDAIEVEYGLSNYYSGTASAQFECSSISVDGPFSAASAADADYDSTTFVCTTGEGYGGVLYWAVTVGLSTNAATSQTSSIAESDVSHAAPSISSVTYLNGNAATNLSTAGSQTLILEGTDFGPVTTSSSGTYDFYATYGPLTSSATKYDATSCLVTTAHTEAECTSAAGVGADLYWVATRGTISSDSITSATVSYAAPVILDSDDSSDIVGGTGATSSSTEGDDYFYIIGSNFGPTTEVLTPTITYGPTGTEYTASDCSVVTSYTKIGCYTAEGTGKGYAAIVTVGGQSSDVSYKTNISYAAPTISYYEGEWDSDADRTGQLAAGGEWVIIYGENFGSVSDNAIDAVYYGSEADSAEYVACDVNHNYGGVDTRRLSDELHGSVRSPGPWHAQMQPAKVSSASWPHETKRSLFKPGSKYSPTHIRNQRLEALRNDAVSSPEKDAARRTLQANKKWLRPARVKERLARRTRRATRRLDIAIDDFGYGFTDEYSSYHAIFSRRQLLDEDDDSIPSALPTPEPSMMPQLAPSYSFAPSGLEPSYTFSPTYTTAPTATMAPTVSCNCYVTVSHTAINCTTPPATGTDHLWTVIIDGQASSVATTDSEAPSISSISGAGASDADYAGGEGIRLYGENFGNSDDTLEFVTYGPSGGEWTARNCTVVSDAEISCKTEPGIGTDMIWEVKVDGQTGTSSATTSYATPSLVAITDSTGESTGGSSHVISGYNLGLEAPNILISLYWDGSLEAMDGLSTYSQFTEDYVYDCSTDDDSELECWDITLPEMDDTEQSRTVEIKLTSTKETTISVSSTNSIDFTYDSPYITSIANTDGEVSGDTDLVVYGTSFATDGYVTINDEVISTTSWDHERITLTYTGTKGNLTVVVGEEESNTVTFKDNSPVLMYGYTDYSPDPDGYRTDALEIPGNGQTRNCTLAGYYMASGVDDYEVYVGDFQATVISGGDDVTDDFPDAERTVRSVTFEIPEGYGTDNMVVVYSQGRSSYSGNLSEVHYVDYNAPVVESVTQQHVNTSGGVVSFLGYNFGKVASVVDVVATTYSTASSIEYTVMSVTHYNLTVMVEEGVGSAESTIIEVDDQSTTLYDGETPGAVDFYPPVINYWTPSYIESNDGGVIEVYGYNFGASPTTTWFPSSTNIQIKAGDHTYIRFYAATGQGYNKFSVVAGDQNDTALIGYITPILYSLVPNEAPTKGGEKLIVNGTNLGIASDYSLELTSYSGEYQFTSADGNINVTSYDDDGIVFLSPEGQSDGDMYATLQLCSDIDYSWSCMASTGIANFSFEPPRVYYFSGGKNDEDVLFTTCYTESDDDDDADCVSVTTTCDRYDSDACGVTTRGGVDDDYTVTIVGENFGTDQASVSWNGEDLDDDLIVSIDHEALVFYPPESSGKDIPVKITIGKRESNAGYFSYDPPWVTYTSPQSFDADGDTIYLYGRNFGQTLDDAGDSIRVWIDGVLCSQVSSGLSIWQVSSDDDDSDPFLWCTMEDRVRVGSKALQVEVAYQNNSWTSDEDKISAECGSGKYGQEAWQVYYTEYGICYEDNNNDWDCSAYAAACMDHWNENISTTAYDSELSEYEYYHKGGWLTTDAERLKCYTTDPCYEKYLWGAGSKYNCSVLTRFDEYCVECPDGSECADTNSLYPVEPIATSGHYRLSLDGLSNSNCDTDREHRTTCWEFVACSPTDACLGNNTCDDGYTKEKCGECCDVSNIDTADCKEEKDDDQYYYRTNGKCEKCPENIALTACLIITAAICAGYTAYILKKKRVDIGIFSIGIDFMQVLSIFASANLSWPPAIDKVYNALAVFNFDFMEIFPPACSVSIGYETEWWIIELTPLGIGALIFIIYGIGMVIIKAFGGHNRKAEKHKLRRLKSTMIGVALYLFYFTYLLVAQNTLDIFNCGKIEDDDDNNNVQSTHKYLESEPNEQCWKSGEMQYSLVPWASIFFVVYVIGYPVVLASVLLPEGIRALMFDDQLLRAQGKGWDDEGITDYLFQLREVRVRYALLYYRFKPLYNYWFIPVVIRKCFLACFSLIFRSSASFQLAALLLVMFVAYVAHCKALPYMSPHDREEVLSKNVARCALLYEEEQKCEKARDLVLHGRHKKVLIFQAGPGDQLFSRRHLGEAVTQEFIDYNNVESFLLAACILICLFGVMLDSEYLGSGNHRDEKHIIINLCITVIIISLIYYFLVVWHEIIGAIFPSLRFTCFGLLTNTTTNENKDDDEDLDEGVEFADGNAQFAQGAGGDEKDEEQNIMTVQEQLEAKRLIERLGAENRQLKHDLQIAQMAKNTTRGRFRKTAKKRTDENVELDDVFAGDNDTTGGVELAEIANPMRQQASGDQDDVQLDVADMGEERESVMEGANPMQRSPMV